MILKNNVYAWLLVVCLGCIEPIHIPVDENHAHIIAEGYITDQPGPHLITIKWSDNYTRVYAPQKVVEGQVLIKDDLGVTTRLIDSIKPVQTPTSSELCFRNTLYINDIHAGFKTPSDFRAQPGRSYVLEVRTEDRHFMSLPVRLPDEPVELDTVFALYEPIPTANKHKFHRQVNIYAGWNDPRGLREFYRWNLYGKFDYTVMHPKGKDCQRCFVDDYNPVVSPISDVNNDDAYHIRKIASLPYDGFRFQRKYLLDVEHLSIPVEAYRFYNLTHTQLSIDGEIFDPAPARLTTNLFQLEGEPTQVAGFFGAFRSSRKTIAIENIIPQTDTKSVIFRGSCRQYTTSRYDFGYTEKPTSWPWKYD